MKITKQKRTLYFLLLIIVFLFATAGSVIIFINFAIESSLLWISLLLVVAYLILRPLQYKFERYNLQYKRLLLIDLQEKPIKSIIHPNSTDFDDRLKNNQYKIYKNLSDYKILYKVETNKNNYDSRKGQLSMIVVLNNENMSFHHEMITRNLNSIESDLVKKQKLLNYTISIFKSVQDVNDKDLEELSEVYFDRTSRMNITSINVLYVHKTKQFQFLHSNVYAPNAYYKAHTNFIKKIIE